MLVLWISVGIVVLAHGLAARLHASLRPPAAEAAFRHSLPQPGTVEVVQTSADLSQRLTRLPDLPFAASPVPGIPVINVDDAVRYQRIAGFGGAMTDTSAWLLHNELSPAARAAAMQNLFGAQGIHLNMVRVPMGASDFTRDGRPYTYDDLAPGRSDRRLSHFSTAHDNAYVLPALREMVAINPHATVLASPWSPPAWMKTNRSLNNWRKGARLLHSAYRPLAQYFVKFIQAYAQAGVRIAAITPQNEPEQATSYPGMTFPESSEARWITRDLRPALRLAGLRPKVYAFDFYWGDSRYPRALVSSAPAVRAVSGVAWHCYVGNVSAMTAEHYLMPRLGQIETECSPGISPGPSAELVIASIRNWASTVMLWNLALDPRGGPVQPPDSGCMHCTAPLTINEATGTVSYNADYYQLGQASAFVQPGAHRIGSGHFVSYDPAALRSRRGYATAGLDDVAFENPDASKVLLAYNGGSQPAPFAINSRGRWLTYTLPAGATVTLIWDQR